MRDGWGPGDDRQVPRTRHDYALIAMLGIFALAMLIIVIGALQ